MKTLTLAAAFAALIASPLAAFDMDAMTDAERDAFRAEIRAYLLDNPEVLMEAIAVLEERQASQQAQGDIDLVSVNAEAIFNDGYSWVGGNPDGDITVVEFMDYRCGYCKKAHPEVTELLGTDGNIRFIVKEFPILGDQSVLAARFAIAVKKVMGDDAYGRAHDDADDLPRRDHRGCAVGAVRYAGLRDAGGLRRDERPRGQDRSSTTTARWRSGCRSTARPALSSKPRCCAATCRWTACCRSWRKSATTAEIQPGPPVAGRPRPAHST